MRPVGVEKRLATTGAARATPDLRCPICGFFASRVTDSRPHESYIRRTRECGWCGVRYTTRETVIGDERIRHRLTAWLGGRIPRSGRSIRVRFMATRTEDRT